VPDLGVGLGGLFLVPLDALSSGALAAVTSDRFQGSHCVRNQRCPGERDRLAPRRNHGPCVRHDERRGVLRDPCLIGLSG
jgi:hypothetical protein